MSSVASDQHRENSGSSAGGGSSNSNRIRKGKIPIPVSVSLYNLFPASKEAAAQKKIKKWFRPEHAMSLLHQVRLEIVIAPPPSSITTANANADQEYGKYDKIVYSSTAAFKTVHPSWNHLDDCIEDYLAIDGYYDSETSHYRNMRLRVWLSSDDEKRNGGQNYNNDRQTSDESEDKQSEEDSSEVETESDIDNKQKMPKRPLLDVCIHPTKLSRLAKLPPRLPINSIILHFSDGSIRSTRSLLELVGDQDGSHSDENLKDEFGRFGDDVFRTLDSVTPSKKQHDIAHYPASESEKSPIRNDHLHSFAIQRSGRQVAKEEQDRLALEGKFISTENDVRLLTETSEEKYLEQLIQLEEEGLEEELQLLQQVRYDIDD